MSPCSTSPNLSPTYKVKYLKIQYDEKDFNLDTNEQCLTLCTQNFDTNWAELGLQTEMIVKRFDWMVDDIEQFSVEMEKEMLIDRQPLIYVVSDGVLNICPFFFFDLFFNLVKF